MTDFLATSISGWFAAFLIMGSAALPYVIRSGLPQAESDLSEKYRCRMQAHFWIGFIILGVCLLHLIVPLSSGMAGRAQTAGIIAAALAFVGVLIQVVLGTRLEKSLPLVRLPVRRLHILGLIMIMLLTGIHVIINSPLLSVMRL